MYKYLTIVNEFHLKTNFCSNPIYNTKLYIIYNIYKYVYIVYIKYIYIYICRVVTSKPRRFLSILRNEKEGVWKDAFRNRISQVHAQWRTLRVERTSIAPEYGSTSRKDAITPFFTSSAIVGPNFESRNLILLTRDWTTRDLI